MGASLRDRATRPTDQAASHLGDTASVPSAALAHEPCTCEFGRAPDGSEFGPCPSCEERQYQSDLLERDAARWRFTQRRGYFCCGPISNYGDFGGYSVGIKIDPKATLNAAILGRGNTLQDAIDKALAALAKARGETL